MPLPTKLQIENLGPNVMPFERRGNPQFKIQDGEAITELFQNAVYDATEDSLPLNVILVDKLNILNGDANDAKYLWIINESGLRIILEQTVNPHAGRKVVCHTNLTGGELALQGGELWFDMQGHVYLNNKSGRYGASTLKHREAILDYFRFVGYGNVFQLLA
jgi:hypothetical protein